MPIASMQASSQQWYRRHCGHLMEDTIMIQSVLRPYKVLKFFAEVWPYVHIE